MPSSKVVNLAVGSDSFVNIIPLACQTHIELWSSKKSRWLNKFLHCGIL